LLVINVSLPAPLPADIVERAELKINSKIFAAGGGGATLVIQHLRPPGACQLFYNASLTFQAADHIVRPAVTRG
jgi:hypothetical protein